MQIKFRRSEMGPVFTGTYIRTDGASFPVEYRDGFGCKTRGWFLTKDIVS